MKLYTESEVRKIYDLAFINLDQDGCHIIDEDKYFEDKINELTPIELPSDEEIENNAYTDRRVEDLEYHEQIGFERGAKWLKQQILNQNK